MRGYLMFDAVLSCGILKYRAGDMLKETGWNRGEPRPTGPPGGHSLHYKFVESTDYRLESLSWRIADERRYFVYGCCEAWSHEWGFEILPETGFSSSRQNHPLEVFSSTID